MEGLTKRTFAGMVDMVELAPDTTLDTVRALVGDGVAHGVASVGCPYCYHPQAMTMLREQDPDGRVRLLGGAGFPDGNWPTEVKLASIRTCLDTGCGEIDLTSNLGWVKSGMLDAYREELRQVRELVGETTLKLIVHAPQLTPEELRAVCAIAVETGMDYVKTDTGRSPAPTTPEQIELIRSCVGDRLKIKASGGVRGIETVRRMLEAGADRFGMSRAAALAVLRELPE